MKRSNGFALLIFLAVVPLVSAVDLVSGISFFKRTVTSSDVSTTSSTTFATLANTVVIAPPGASQVSVRFSAESRCTELGGTAVNWCEMRVLINGIEAEPRETVVGQDFAFDSTNGGNATSGSYEAHSMDRTDCVRNSTSAIQPVRVEVQYAVTNLDGGSAPTFWIDDSSLIVDVSQGCTVVPEGTTTTDLLNSVQQ